MKQVYLSRKEMSNISTKLTSETNGECQIRWTFCDDAASRARRAHLLACVYRDHQVAQT